MIHSMEVTMILDNSEDQVLLEALIDKHGLDDVLSEIVTICRHKAEHVAVNWQDMALAKAWDRTADRLWETTLIAQPITVAINLAKQ